MLKEDVEGNPINTFWGFNIETVYIDLRALSGACIAVIFGHN